MPMPLVEAFRRECHIQPKLLVNPLRSPSVKMHGTSTSVLSTELLEIWIRYGKVIDKVHLQRSRIER